ncbi:MAG: hypothetical protein HYY16_02635 [Planctomycetes bacterium]|nr:hypothetical protein [Planctomycetota bacterium]
MLSAAPALLLAVSLMGAGQTDPPPAAIVDARIVIDPNTTLEKATIVLRDGLIAGVGETLQPPADAEIVDGSGLTVYAGFIDAYTNLGLAATKRTEEQRRSVEGEPTDFARGPSCGMEPANRKGIRAEVNAADVAVLAQDEAAKWRAGGFTSAVVAVGEEYWSGRGALLALSGEPRRNSMLRPSTGMYASFHSYGEGYPTTLMGAMAHLRQSLLDARRHRDVRETYMKKPDGRRPPADPCLEALQDVIERRITVFWLADSEIEIGGALTLAEEFGFPMAIVGGAEAFKVTERLKRAGVPVVLSLKWPKEPKEEKTGDDIRDIKPERLKELERSEWEERVRCAIRLHENGIPFCFTSRGIAPDDVLEKIEQLVSRGRPRETALSALTAAPAALLGVESRLGRLTMGSVANLTVLSGQLGDRRIKVKVVFADGRKWDVGTKKRGPPEIDVAGLWRLTVKDLTASMELKQTDADVAGTIRTPKGEADIEGRVAGRNFEFTFKLGTETREFVGVLKDNKLAGTMKGPEGLDIEWTAVRPE